MTAEDVARNAKAKAIAAAFLDANLDAADLRLLLNVRDDTEQNDKRRDAAQTALGLALIRASQLADNPPRRPWDHASDATWQVAIQWIEHYYRTPTDSEVS